MKIVSAMAIVLALTVTPALASWDEQTIEHTNGDTIMLSNGNVYQLESSDDISSWQDGDTVLVNDDGDKMIDKDQDSDPVDVSQIN